MNCANPQFVCQCVRFFAPFSDLGKLKSLGKIELTVNLGETVPVLRSRRRCLYGKYGNGFLQWSNVVV